MPKQRGSAQSARSPHQQQLWERSMRFESQWPGDAIAAPIWGMYDREDAFCESLDGRSWNRVDGRSDQADADPAAVVLPAGVDADIAPIDFAGWRAWITSIASIVAELWSRM